MLTLIYNYTHKLNEKKQEIQTLLNMKCNLYQSSEKTSVHVYFKIDKC